MVDINTIMMKKFTTVFFSKLLWKAEALKIVLNIMAVTNLQCC